jgi:DNA-binding beta-propeller fold protein YncE
LTRTVMRQLLWAILVGWTLAVTASAQSPNSGADLLVLHKIKSQADLPGNLAFVDFVSGKVLARVPVGREPHELAASPDGKYAMVTNTGNYQNPGNTLSLIDIGTQKEIRRIDLGPLWNPHGLVYRDGRFYFTAEGSRAIGAYDPVTDHVVWIMGTGQDTTHMLVFSGDGKMIFASNRGSHTVTMLELNSSSPLKTGSWRESVIPVCRGPEGIDISPDGNQVWVGCRMSNEVGIISVSERRMIATFPTGTKALARVKFTLDGQRLLATDLTGGELSVWDVATRQVLKRLKMGTGCEGILILPDGKRALIGVTNDDNVAEIDLQSLEITRRIQTGEGPDGMVWIGKR